MTHPERSIRPSRRTVLRTSSLGLVGIIGGTATAGTAAAGGDCDVVVDGDGGADYETIQKAVDNASPGDTICVKRASSPYAESVQITKPLTFVGDPGKEAPGRDIAGAGPDAPRLDGTNVDNFTNVAGFRLRDPIPDVTIKGFEIRNYGDAGNPGHAVKAGAGNDNFTVRDNTFRNFTGNGIVAFSDGSPGRQYRNWTVKHNVIEQADVIGVRFHNVTESVIAENVINDNFTGVVLRTGSSQVEVSRNAIRGSSDNGAGIDTQEGVNDVLVAKNDIRDNDGDGVRANPGMSIHLNNIVGNGREQFEYGVQKRSTIENDLRVSAERNWWGARNGPSGVADGDGDKVGPYVNYEPWLRASFPER